MPVFPNVKNTGALPRPGGQSLRWVFLLAALLLSLGCRTAWAQTFSCSGTSGTITVTMPASVTVPRDAVNGTLLTPWVQSAANNYLSCTVTNWSVGPDIRSLLTDSGQTVMGPNGVTYRVWNTNVTGVGVAIGYQQYSCDAWTVWQAASSAVRISVCGGLTVGTIAVVGGVRLELALVKTGPITPGVTSNAPVAEAGWTSAYPTPPNTPRIHHSDILKTFTLTPTTINVAACETPNVSVNMGKHMRAQFSGVGYTTPTVAFDVNINACPAGSLTTIQYQFIPVNAVIDANNGLLALDSNATATGIALQLKDGSDAPLKFNTPYTLAGYSKAAGGSYKVPLKAAYRQTAATVTPGSANAALTFTMTYQ
jgi:major type 1 subunit fimbrin (pilin)